MGEKVIVITGASAGIGAAAAVLLASRGHLVGLVARRRDALDGVAAKCSGRGHSFVADVSRREDVRRTVEGVLSRFGRLDVWINNAGRGISRMPSQLTDQDVDEMMLVNVKSVLYGMQEVLPHFRERGEGHVINISSMLGRVPYIAVRSAYCGAKHFMNAMTITFRDEVQQSHPGIQFSLVSPGVVYTDFGLNAAHGGVDSRTLPYGQTPEQVAEVIAQVVDSRAPDVYTRSGAQQQVLEFYRTHGTDPDARGAS